MTFRRALCSFAILSVLLCATILWRAHSRLPSSPVSNEASQLSSVSTTSPPAPSRSLNSAGGSSPVVDVVPERSSDEVLTTWANSISEPKFARFAQWAVRYARASQAEQRALENEGIELAQHRRDELSDLIQADPERAIQLSVPFAAREKLPPSVAAWMEKPISGRGDLSVLAALPAPGHEGEIAPVYRKATINGETYDAFVYGRRLGEPTRESIPLHGVAVDQFFAVHENPVRILDAAEAVVRKQQLAKNTDPLCQISGLPSRSRGQEIAADVGGEIQFLCSPEHAEQLNEQLIAAEARTASAPVEVAAGPAASTYTEGIKKVIVIRVDFSDLEGEPFSETEGEDLISGVNGFYREMSYGKTGFDLAGEGSDVTPTFRMPNTAAYYGPRDPSVLRKDAHTAATAAGYILSDYNFDLICVGPIAGYKFAGLGFVGAAGAWIRDTSSPGVAAHELGHNFGLNHANFWDTAGQSVIGPGTSVEYGDKFDTMGSANAGSKHFNARYKSYLNWLTPADVKTVTSNGTYRIFAQDDPASSGWRALRIAKNSATNYWVEYRARYAGNKWLAYGAGLRWGGVGNQSTRLLDATPGTSAGKDDSCILIGRTFSDPVAGVHITPVGRGTDTVGWLDVVVNKGSFSENLAPQLSLAAPVLNAPTRTDLSFVADASDPNGDALAYFWDFGDGTWGGNLSTSAHSWNATGEYLVQCVVTDMKGGVARRSVAVRIGSPNTYHISGHVLAEGKPVQGVRVAASSTQMTYTDSDGRYQLVGLPAGTYTLKTALEDYLFNHPGFINPIAVGPSRENIDFVAVPPDGQNTMSLVAAGSVWQYLDDGSNQGSGWREIDFDDSKWTEGPAPLGYGDDNEKTVVRFGPSSNNKYITTYFRHRFTVVDPKLVSALTLNLRRDDGAVVYLNSREIFRSNMAGGAITSSTLASSTVGGADEAAFFQAEVDPAWLRSGTNVFAVEVHQAARNSSDLVFDLELLGTAAAVPTPPNLGWELTGDGLKLTWPIGAETWTLYSSSELGSQSTWSPLSSPVSESNGQRQVVITPSSTQFYRLGSAP